MCTFLPIYLYFSPQFYHRKVLHYPEYFLFEVRCYGLFFFNQVLQLFILQKTERIKMLLQTNLLFSINMANYLSPYTCCRNLEIYAENCHMLNFFFNFLFIYIFQVSNHGGVHISIFPVCLPWSRQKQEILTIPILKKEIVCLSLIIQHNMWNIIS